MSQSTKLQTAELDWELVDGIEVPISKQFGDVYFSKDNGLLETRHVFLNGNDLTERLSQLNDYQYFCVGETGFGTGLNILTLWQLWQQVRPDNHSHLHAISVEKFPLNKADLIRALNVWPELKPLAEQLIQQYPLPIAGCHRLSFPEERFSIDLWLGDAQDIFPSIPKTQAVNAWFLDGFAPSCNPDMWQENVLNHIVRLSEFGTTFASFSVAGVLKRGLKQHGVQISRPRGFGHKREMLKAIWLDTSSETSDQADSEQNHATSQAALKIIPRQIAIIGAGIAGLSAAWAFAQRGHQVTVYEQNEPLSGASGNPLALLNPKLCPIEQAHEHLMTLSWQHALNFYPRFKAFRPIQVQQMALKNADELLNLAEQYPSGVLSTQDQQDATPETDYPSLTLHQAGAVSPQLLRDEILLHPNIKIEKAKISRLNNADNQTELWQDQQLIATADDVIVCCAKQSAKLFENYPVLKPIRGQVSWVENREQPLALDQAYSYGGYCMQLDAAQLILGASFYPNRDDIEVLAEDHVHNYELIHSVFPEYAQQLPSTETWQGRASVRAQSLDYFPLVGKMQNHQQIYTFAGLGSKGFLFAPLCSEVLAALVLGELCPIPQSLLDKLNPQRFQKKIKAKKPYYSG
ncbi:FAD-dependent 5-carboxymethylaminomethyl-2-thiouridine(34) oxidoreductase MnmC [Acinetobacter genomosp. 15BJ]|uniref:tRNA 5-methylaminomethyl-2-thiouridine biosynthesis bifunctional protein MnmC n=1 Tax=Acinetobacter genomosp. 15BJ TaxID=106651 RepID=R9ASH1_9GAMM|nr:FAD-dependent 5-carboxymethylaminomethyl-2-thiouridine(34) oxidoreductase MnmC [Acinetobacter genomosp. 15BJ]EOR05133.1 tRNA 5-methylaminomethyl-2-thiouridine biosynthesis mnmC [Acinetobacter genomosp. 15BJ]MCH7292908.1 FAD-dependent 5-carboxymethylaminomethyl-2-thiouridine(34) oxidoreductase MnmC [Acinetobacter genomosp. 15BJ]MDO3658108.1 FAD-dependent 5-carboxymethylaminomethyl-2-thiouridine(34) oxidoreductase MnmC [Acinetobacter genomosp. 15BJ]